jgi:hypothetical protein
MSLLGPIERQAEKDLRMYWWNGVGWSSSSDTGVDTASHYVWVNVRNEAVPTLTDLSSTIFAPGAAAISLNPDTGAKGTSVSVSGSGFFSNDTAVVMFNGTQLGTGTIYGSGAFNNLTFVIETLVPGVYQVQ